MREHSSALELQERAEHETPRNYLIGYLLSILLTMAAFAIAELKLLSGHPFNFCVLGLAIAQALVQLIFFLHLGKESKPRWKLAAFLYMLFLVVILVGGTLWIMYNLEYNMMGKNS